MKRFDIVEHGELRSKLGKQYGNLVDELTAMLFEHDPVGLNYEFNSDEYESEALALLARIDEADSVESLHGLLYSIFVEYFDERLAGTRESYIELSQAAWELLQKHSVK